MFILDVILALLRIINRELSIASVNAGIVIFGRRLLCLLYRQYFQIEIDTLMCEKYMKYFYVI